MGLQLIEFPMSKRWIPFLWLLFSQALAAAARPPMNKGYYKPYYPIIPRQSPPNPGFTLTPNTTAINNGNLTVMTTSGLMTGTIDPKNPNVRAFLSIPYAQPPVDERRWKPPQRLTDAMKVPRDVSRYGPSCQQFPDLRQAGFFGLPPEFNVVQTAAATGNITGREGEGTFDEDCLTLSVHAPLEVDPNNPLPVLIFIHGGAMLSGGVNVPVQNPAPMVNNSRSHIVVAMNYRLGIFGFPGAAGVENATENNLAFLDQRMAIEWARDNVAAFGGDPSKMILWGQNAGAFSVEVHDFAYANDPIVSGLIASSGNVFQPAGIPELETSNFTFVASMLCAPSDGPRTPDEEMNCLRQVPGRVIQKFMNGQQPRDGSPPEVKFGPTVDGILVLSRADYEARNGMGMGSIIPLVIGSNSDEHTTFLPNQQSAANRNVVDKMTAQGYTCPSSKTAFYRNLANNPKRPVYVYQYAGNFSNISPDPLQGAFHGSELPMLFMTAGNFRNFTNGNVTDDFQTATAQQMFSLWVQFARDANGTGLTDNAWPKYKTGDAIVFARDEINMQTIPDSMLEENCTQQELGGKVFSKQRQEFPLPGEKVFYSAELGIGREVEVVEVDVMGLS